MNTNFYKFSHMGKLFVAASLILFQSCNSDNKEQVENDTNSDKQSTLSLQQNSAGSIDGQEVFTYILENEDGIRVEVSNYGGIISRLYTRDKNGELKNVVLGFDEIEDYQDNPSYLGSTIGRYANRIAAGKFSLNSEQYDLATNDGAHSLHGGEKGFNKVVWTGETIEDDGRVGVKLTYTSPDGEEGFPGTAEVEAVFEITKKNKLSIQFRAKSDKDTPFNLTHHGYFNFSNENENVLDHQLRIYAEKYTPADETLIPTGELVKVKDTPFDFRKMQKVGDRIEQVEGGYDHNYVIKEKNDDKLKKMAELYHEASGRVMEVHSNAPGIQFYSGNFLDGATGIDGVAYNKHWALCLEPQLFPDSPNQPDFPSAILKAGEMYNHRIEYHFSTR